MNRTGVTFCVCKLNEYRAKMGTAWDEFLPIYAKVLLCSVKAEPLGLYIASRLLIIIFLSFIHTILIYVVVHDNCALLFCS